MAKESQTTDTRMSLTEPFTEEQISGESAPQSVDVFGSTPTHPPGVVSVRGLVDSAVVKQAGYTLAAQEADLCTGVSRPG